MFVLDEADEMLSRGFKDQIYDVFKTLNEEIQVGVGRCIDHSPAPSYNCPFIAWRFKLWKLNVVSLCWLAWLMVTRYM